MKARPQLCLKDALLDNAHGGKSNNINCNLRKRLYCEFLLMNGIATQRQTDLPPLCWIKTLYPRKVYICFKRSYGNVDNKAGDIHGEKLKVKSW